MWGCVGMYVGMCVGMMIEDVGGGRGVYGRVCSTVGGGEHICVCVFLSFALRGCSWK